MATTQEVWDHHVQAFGGRDVSMVREDYDDGSVLIANGEVYKGPERIGQFFKDLFVELPKNCTFDLTNCIALDKNVFIMWKADVAQLYTTSRLTRSPFEDGKITLQTVAFVKRTKG